MDLLSGNMHVNVQLNRIFIPLALVLFSATLRAADTMKAIIVSGKQPQLQSVARPVPGAGQILIKVRATSVNPADWKVASIDLPMPWIPGWDAAGVVQAVGPGVSEYHRGDAVMAFFERRPDPVKAAPNAGGYAQYAVVGLGVVARKPAKASFEEAAGIPLAAVTAWKALIDEANLQSGQRVLIHGGAGGVGSSAVQIAKSRGAYVIATASPRNNDFLKKIGADEIIDYNSVRFEDRLKDLDVVLNTVDADTGIRSLQVLKPGAVLVSVVAPTPPDQCGAAKVRCTIVDRGRGTPINQLLAQVSKLVDAGKYDVHIDATLPLAEVSKAWDMNRSGHTRGKIVLTVPQ